MRAPLAALLIAAALALAGCGGGSSSTSSTGPTTSSAAVEKAAKEAATLRQKAEARAPKGASPTLRAIYATFPPPKPDSAVKRSGPAIKAGEKACAGKTPTEVKEEFYGAAQTNLEPEQKQMIARIGSFEGSDSTDASFTAGQLAADVYEATLPEAIGQYGYEGCVYALARGLEQRLAPKGQG
jgi:hypothetical protein